jgi:phage tail-like protein
MASSSTTRNPGNSEIRALANSCFYVSIGSLKLVFSELSGLKFETEVLDYQEGGENTFTHRLPGRSKASNLVLKRGMAPTREFLDWYMKIASGNIDRQNISVEMFDLKGTVIVRWEFANAYPVSWTGPSFVASDATLAVETLELAHDGIIRVSP